MTILAMNLLLALVWLALTGEITPLNFALGFAAGYAALRVVRRALPDTAYFGKLSQLVRFVLFFLVELVKANLRVAYDVLTPTHHMQPGVVAIPLDLETDEEITLLATLITLTPGTLCLDVSGDRRTLYLHAMYVRDPEATRAEIKHGFERRVMELLR
jgi:multicomponent Na+:H+ antiporter subunit E